MVTKLSEGTNILWALVLEGASLFFSPTVTPSVGDATA